MSELPINIAEYGKHHRSKQRGFENGTVEATGTRVKKWLGWYHIYVPQPDGTEKRLKRRRTIGECSKMSKSQARSEHSEWIRRLHAQPVATTQRATLAQLCDDYYALKEGDWDEATREINRATFVLVKESIGAIPIEAVTAETLKTFIGKLATRRWYPKTSYKRRDDSIAVVVSKKAKTGISQSYVRKIICKLRAVFDLASERDLIRKNPARSIATKLVVPKAATAADKSVLAPQDLPPLLAALSERDALVVLLSLIGGTRPNELFALRSGDVGPNWFRVQRALDKRRHVKSTKTSKSRTVILPEQTAQELNTWIRTNSIGAKDFVFTNQDGTPVSRSTFLKKRLRRAATRAKIATLDVDFQMLRRSFSTLGHLLGVDVKSIQNQLGHSRPDMTLGEYIQGVDGARASQLQRFEDILRGKKPMPVDAAARIGTVLIQ